MTERVDDAGPQTERGVIARALVRMGLVGADTPITMTPLAGGVSSDVYRADLPGGPVCVKRALPKLKVAADWRAPVERNHWEVEWMRVAGGIVPHAVPAILGEDRDSGCFAMAYLAPDRHPVWKNQLLEGTIELSTARAVGDILGAIHGATADSAGIAQRFSTDEIFYAIRLEPYLVATARSHPDISQSLERLVHVTRTTKRALVHGDYSPKNMLIGSNGPVIVDAECAWYGDPAFDLAFVLNHLLLKGAHEPQWRVRYDEAFLTLASAYIPHVGWELPTQFEARTAALLPALMLARIDGKSPVEYLVDDATKDEVRAFARPLIRKPVARLGALAELWLKAAA
jgi:aminoglycoside phosphotransferase (APT) family kinase protein